MTPAEKFNDVLDKYEYHGVEPIECWATDDLLELEEAIRAELADRDGRAQQEYFEETTSEGFEIDEEWCCSDPACACNAAEEDSAAPFGGEPSPSGGSYGGTL